MFGVFFQAAVGPRQHGVVVYGKKVALPSGIWSKWKFGPFRSACRKQSAVARRRRATQNRVLACGNGIHPSPLVRVGAVLFVMHSARRAGAAWCIARRAAGALSLSLKLHRISFNDRVALCKHSLSAHTDSLLHNTETSANHVEDISSQRVTPYTVSGDFLHKRRGKMNRPWFYS